MLQLCWIPKPNIYNDISNEDNDIIIIFERPVSEMGWWIPQDYRNCLYCSKNIGRLTSGFFVDCFWSCWDSNFRKCYRDEVGIYKGSPWIFRWHSYFWDVRASDSSQKWKFFWFIWRYGFQSSSFLGNCCGFVSWKLSNKILLAIVMHWLYLEAAGLRQGSAGSSGGKETSFARAVLHRERRTEVIQ